MSDSGPNLLFLVRNRRMKRDRNTGQNFKSNPHSCLEAYPWAHYSPVRSRYPVRLPGSIRSLKPGVFTTEQRLSFWGSFQEATTATSNPHMVGHGRMRNQGAINSNGSPSNPFVARIQCSKHGSTEDGSQKREELACGTCGRTVLGHELLWSSVDFYSD